jgi:radical SAM family protein
MLRFPPRLTWDLTKVRIAQTLFGKRRRPLALRLDLPDFASSEDVSADESSKLHAKLLRSVRTSKAPFVWIGGAAPSNYPGIGTLARAIVSLGRTVFVELDGSVLRRRIHEFRPESRLYLVLPLQGPQLPHDARVGRAGSFRATLEAIRQARLSGFHLCVLTTIFPDSNFSELHELPEIISASQVDGWVHAPLLGSHAGQSFVAARDLIVDRRWRKFSELLAASAHFSARIQSSGYTLDSPLGVSANSDRDLRPDNKRHITEQASSDEGIPAL